MNTNHFNLMKEKLLKEYNLDLISDVVLSPKNQIILFSDVKDRKNIKLELISGSLEIIGLDAASELCLNDLLATFDYNNSYALVSGEIEYFKAVKDEILEFDSEPNVTFPIITKKGKHWIRFTVIPLVNHPNLITVFITDVSKYLIEDESLFHKTHHDSLTNLFNKYTLDYHYGERYQFDNFHVLFLDLDNFKEVNDVMGHQIGDRYLKDFSDILKQYESNYSRFYRIGGDEFVGLFFQETKNILSITNEILVKTNELSIKYKTTKLSVSIGVVKADSRDDVIRKADKLLYKAKELGKNQFVFEEEKNIKS
ncbi:GGDEF domain-containing protein [Liberiplasma polymorphum]|uniref:GGDEF domain-containing protein n=1 Tax=Liberiplasma polymorphum TaxID=3374570 RepID=UPI0037718FB2